MKRFTALSLLAALTVVAALATTALAQDALPRLIVPESSIEHPGDAGVRMHTNFVYLENHNPTTLGSTWETPASIACVYKLVKQIAGCPIATASKLPTGGSKAIALVDAYDNPDASTNLATFSAQFGLPAANFMQVYASGKKPANNPGGWSLEEALDIEWAHAMAPNAQIILVEAASSSDADLYAAETLAANLVVAAGGGEVSNSWSGGEYSSEAADATTYFSTPGVVYFASTGDSAFALGFPAVASTVVAAGGTSLKRNASTGDISSEAYWDNAYGGGGGGLSQFITRPTYQNGISGIVGSKRGVPDISSDADPLSGVAMYDADKGNGFAGGWLQVGGTSVSSPSLAGIINSAGSFASSSTTELTELYNDYGNATTYKADFRDITKGNAKCTTGWDICTGIGAPITYVGK